MRATSFVPLLRRCPLLLINLLYGLLSQLLSKQFLHNILLPRLPIPNRNHDPRRNIAAYATAQNHCCERKRPDVITDRPRTSAQRDLQRGMHIAEHDDDNEEGDREGMVRVSFVRFVEGVGASEAALV